MPEPLQVHAETFIGHVDELALLVETIKSGRSPVLIRGGAGLGKTRLVREACRRVDDYDVVEIACSPSQPNTSLTSLLYRLALAVPSVRAWLDSRRMSSEDRPTSGTPALSLADEVALLLGAPDAKQILLVIDDVHWCSAEALGFLSSLAGYRLPNLTLVLVERIGPGGAKDRPKAWLSLSRESETIELKPLSLDETGRLAMSICGALRESEVDQLYLRSAGNPFYIREVATHLEHSGYLETQDFAEAVAWGHVPADVFSVAELVLDDLSEDLLSVLRIGSTLRDSFTPEVMQAVTGFDRDKLQDLFDEGTGHEILEVVDEESGAANFTNPVLRESIYSSLSPAISRQIHSALGGLPDEGLLPLEELALHRARGFTGKDKQRAARTCLQAATRAENLLAFESAIDLYRLALTCIPSSETSNRAEATYRMGVSQRAAGNWYAAATSLERATRLYRETEKPAEAAEAAYLLGEIMRLRFKLNDAEQWLRTVLNLTTSPGLRMRALALLSGTRTALDDQVGARKLLDETLTISDEVGFVPPEVAAWASFVLATEKNMTAARKMAALGLKEAVRTSDKTNICFLAGSLAFADLGMLRLKQAQDYLQIMEAVGDPHNPAATVRVFYTQWIISAFVGNWQRCYDIADQWMREVRLAGQFQLATAQFLMAEAAFALDKAEEAISLLKSALPRLEAQRPIVSLHLARYFWSMGRVEEARNLVQGVLPETVALRRSLSGRAVLADLAFAIDDIEVVQALYEEFESEDTPMIAVYTPLSTARLRAKLAYRLQRPEAMQYFDSAVATLKGAGANGELVRTYEEYALARNRRGRRGDALKANALLGQAQALRSELGLKQLTMVQEDVQPYGLTAREAQVLDLIARGMKNREIAQELALSVNTVERHVENIIHKMDVSSRAHAVARRAGRY